MLHPKFPSILRKFLLYSLCAILLLGCQLAPRRAQTPTDDPNPLATALHTPSTSAQRPAPTLVPTITPARPTPMPPSPIATATPPPTATPRPSPTPTATLALATRIALAERSAQDGDYPSVIALGEESLRGADVSQQMELAITLARAYIEEGKQREAASLLERVITNTKVASEVAEATGLLGGVYESLGGWRAAITAFERYLTLEKSVTAPVRWHIARAYEALGEDAEAAQQLAAIPLGEFSSARQAETLEELANVRRRLHDYDGALETYQRILAFAARADYRALMQHKQAETLLEAGKQDEAIKQWNAILRESATSYAAYMALNALDKLKAAQVNDLERGEILLRANQYATAIEALQRYLASPSGEQIVRAYYDIGLAQQHLKQYDQAFRAFDTVIDNYPQDALAPSAWMSKAEAATDFGTDPSGIYQEFARRYPEHARVPEALWLAAAELEWLQEWGRAAEFYHRLRTSYPNYEHAREATFREGLAAYVQRDMTTASKVWTEMLTGQLPSDERARVLTWLGLAAQASGDAQGAQGRWQEALAAAPGSYYGLRARDLDAGMGLNLPSEVSVTLPVSQTSEADWNQLTVWVRSWSQITNTLGVNVQQDFLASRGVALERLGWHNEALEAFRGLKDKVQNDPEALLALARRMEKQGQQALVISIAERLSALGIRAGAAEPPKALQKLSYPTTFGHLVNVEAQRRDVDPLLFLALMRQESRFDPRAVSYAGATGLTQVMPATGAWIASQMGESNYRDDLLTRPATSVQYGVWYLAKMLEQSERNWVGALVAYNAGPGSLKRWSARQPLADQDLFYETLPVAQTKDYVRLIYQQYRMYESIYR
jgi:soluble lytic murein transglycosylase